MTYYNITIMTCVMYVLQKNWSRLLADNVFNHLYEVLETEYLKLMVWFSDPHYFRDKFSEIPDNFHQLETFLIQLIDGIAYAYITNDSDGCYGISVYRCLKPTIDGIPTSTPHSDSGMSKAVFTSLDPHILSPRDTWTLVFNSSGELIGMKLLLHHHNCQFIY